MNSKIQFVNPIEAIGCIRKRIRASQKSIDAYEKLQAEIDTYNNSGEPKLKLNLDRELAKAFEKMVATAAADFKKIVDTEVKS